MNILHLTIDNEGGAAKATYNLHKYFKESGHSSKIIVLRKTNNDPDIIQYKIKNVKKTPIGKIKEILNKISYRLADKSTNPDYCFSYTAEELGFVSPTQLLKLLPFIPDVIFIHWISGFINAKTIYELNKLTNAPIFWYALDMAPLTGGCHYAWNCNEYKKSCGTCPALYSTDSNDRSYKNLYLKQHYLKKTDITFIALTSQFEQYAVQSILFREKSIVNNIFLPVNHTLFKPTDKKAVRNVLNIPADKFILLINVHTIDAPRKGFKYLFEALNLVFNNISNEVKDSIFVLTIGNKLNIANYTIPFTQKNLGFLKDDISLALVYQATDVFVCPSIEDAGPIMINESIICGTPVVAFNTGVAPDLIETGKTGYLAKLKDSNDLAQGIIEIISMDRESYDRMSTNCREMGLKKCHPEKHIEQLINIIAAK